MSLERRIAYQIVPDALAEKHHSLRVIDESGEDYLYPANYFVVLQLPQTTRNVLLASETPQKQERSRAARNAAKRRPRTERRSGAFFTD